MWRIFSLAKSIVASAAVTVVFSLPSAGQQAADQATYATKLDELFAQLQKPTVNSDEAEAAIMDIWSRSGSASMDLLLERGYAAMEAQDWDSAIGFFTALTDHAPDFAEGWNARATAYFNAGLIGPSVADIQTTLALEPRHFGAMMGLALILEQVGDPEGALEVWRQVATLVPHDAQVREAIDRLGHMSDGRTL